MSQLIAQGVQAELTLFDPQETWVLDQAHLHTLAQNTPWFREEIRGKVMRIWC